MLTRSHAIRRRSRLIPMLALMTLAACGPSDQDAGMEMGGDTLAPADTLGTPQTAEPMLMLSDTTAQAVWATVENARYRETWDFWPEKQPYYEGGDPHGALLSTYLNNQAAQGLSRMRTQDARDDIPFGSIIVKENYLPDSTLAAVTVMAKIEGYDPAHNDWYWLKRLPDGTVEASGQAQGCIDCHGDAADNWDYLMTAHHQWGGTDMGG